MGDVTSVRFTLARSGAPVYIDTFESLALDVGRRSVRRTRFGRRGADRRGRRLAEDQARRGRDRRHGVAVEPGDRRLRTAAGRLRHRPVVSSSIPRAGGARCSPGCRTPSSSVRRTAMASGTTIRGVAPAAQMEIISAGLVRDQDVTIDFWIHPVTGLVTAAEFTTTYRRRRHRLGARVARLRRDVRDRARRRSMTDAPTPDRRLATRTRRAAPAAVAARRAGRRRLRRVHRRRRPDGRLDDVATDHRRPRPRTARRPRRRGVDRQRLPDRLHRGDADRRPAQRRDRPAPDVPRRLRAVPRRFDPHPADVVARTVPRRPRADGARRWRDGARSRSP